MLDKPRRVAESRIEPRLRVPAMYTLARVKLSGSDRYQWTGHIYDVSMSGMRFELDRALPPGTHIEVRIMLPGDSHTTFRATGRVVRIHGAEDGEMGPVRMGLAFDSFASPLDRKRLGDYIGTRGGSPVRRAA